MAVRKPHSTDHRKSYPVVFQVSLIAALLLLILAFRWDYAPASATYDLQPEETPMFEEVVQTTQPDTPPPPPQPPAPVEVSDDTLIEEEFLRFDADITPDAPLPILEPPTHEEDQPEEKEPTSEYFVAVQEMPELIGGLRAIQSKINYPPMARRARVQGTVTIQFVVDEQGTVQDAVVLKGLGGGCNEEALRVVKQAQFKPGKQRGKSVKVKMSLPITFRLR
ncbi:MAG TPA: TonB family protein [Rhodothermales bacterium]|nr:TonB family protein [Rhodothermales bacterium]